MEETKQILRLHAVRYPRMQPVDAVKLLYQNEFGGGHLIRDEEACLNFLRREYGSIPKDPQTPLYEDIGNGMVRVNLAALTPEELEELGRSFLRSAQVHRGSRDSFLKKLELLAELTAEGRFAFGSGELEQYLAAYTKAGCPMVSHSELYRQSYKPAYRIVCRQAL